MKNELFVGQVLYREKYIRNKEPEIEEVIIGKIGKKYFYLTGWEGRLPVDKVTLMYEDKNYSTNNFRLYKSKQDILDKNEKIDLIQKIRKHFEWHGSSGNNTLDQLREVSKILNIN